VNSNIGVAPNPDPSESDDDVFGDDVPTDGDDGSEGNEGDDGISTRRVADEYEAGNQRIQRDPADNNEDYEGGDDGEHIVMRIKMSVIMCQYRI
jgi:hypothetical protein